MFQKRTSSIYGAFVLLSLFGLHVRCADDSEAEPDAALYACEPPRVGVCVTIRSCPTLFKLLDPIRRTDEGIAFLKMSICGFDNGTVPRVCCPLEGSEFHLPARPEDPWAQNSSTTEATPTATPDLPEEPVDVTGFAKLSLLPLNVCGPGLTGKIFKGKQVDVLEYPWMALLGQETSPGHTEFYCGGTLINNRYILTAAHCVTDRLKYLNSTLVRLGENNIQNETDCYEQYNKNTKCAPPVEEYSVEEIVSHPNYSFPSKFINDIALIRLNQTIDFKEHIRPICLPVGAEQKKGGPGKMIVSGWGLTEYGVKSSQLLQTLVPLVPRQRCADSYVSTKVQISSSRQFCAGDSGADSCAGDSGGPLMDFGEVQEYVHQMIQYGIVSFGPKECASKDRPGVYTRVGFYMDWILDNLRE